MMYMFSKTTELIKKSKRIDEDFKACYYMT